MVRSRGNGYLIVLTFTERDSCADFAITLCRSATQHILILYLCIRQHCDDRCIS